MEFKGQYLVPAPTASVWAALNDPEILKACIPGCESLVKTDETHFAATATLKIGPVKATFKANIVQEQAEPPRRCVLKGEGQGGVAGFARGEAEVILTPEGAGTSLTYVAKATIGGKLAQIGQRLIDGAARQIADDFFSRFAAAVAPAAPSDDSVKAETAPPVVNPSVPVVRSESRRSGVGPEIWVAGLIGVIVILLVLFGVVMRGA